MTDSAETMREALKEARDTLEALRKQLHGEPFAQNRDRWLNLGMRTVDAIKKADAALSASGTKSDGGVESRHAKTGNMSGAVPEEEQSLPASGFVRAFGPEDKTSKPRDGVAPIPSDPIPSPSAPPLSAPVRRLKGGCDG